MTSITLSLTRISPEYRRKLSAGENGAKFHWAVWEAGVNLVEIDLIRPGTFLVAVPEGVMPWQKRTTYIVCIRRAYRPDQAEIISVALEQAVPNFRIPRRHTDPDIALRIQPLSDDCYRHGRCASIDYSQPPRPKLDDKAAAWASEWIDAKKQ